MLTTFGAHDEKTLEQMHDVAKRTEFAALMADGHFGYVMPIGGVAAYDNKVSVVGVGFDIACGNMACKTDVHVQSLHLPTDPTPEDIRDCNALSEIADTIFNTFAFGVGRNNDHPDAPTDDPVFDDPRWDIIPAKLRDPLRKKARRQLGTTGSGNHYVDIFVDEQGYIWSGVHFGSRGFGHTIASNFLALSQGGEWGDRGKEVEVLLDLDTPLGSDYWDLMNLAGRYAYAGREWVARRAARMFGGKIMSEVHNHHNFAWKEEHFGRDLVVVRKGATPAWPGQKGFVGGSMGDNSVILMGSNSRDGSLDESRKTHRLALYSTVHGAGRVMSRMAAKGKVHRTTGRIIREGRISQAMMDGWLDDVGIHLRGGGRDEAPQAYRRLPDVLKAQGETVEVCETLRPLIVCMAP